MSRFVCHLLHTSHCFDKDCSYKVQTSHILLCLHRYKVLLQLVLTLTLLKQKNEITHYYDLTLIIKRSHSRFGNRCIICLSVFHFCKFIHYKVGFFFWQCATLLCSYFIYLPISSIPVQILSVSSPI